jgi:hypothetical protein
MNFLGYCLLIISVSSVTTLTVYCYYKVLTDDDGKED